MRMGLLLVAVGCLVAALVGCQAPCDRMCDAKADYIAACVDETETALDEGRTPPAGWDVYDDPQQWWSDGYGVGGADELADACKDDADDALSGTSGDDKKLVEQECEDEAMIYEAAIEDEEDITCHLVP